MSRYLDKLINDHINDIRAANPHLVSSTFILTWNPSKSPGPADRARAIRQTAAGHRVRGDWSTGNRRNDLGPRDRAFLLRQGPEPRGIIASGTFTSEPRSGEPHDTRVYANLLWDHFVSDDDLLPLDVVKAKVNGRDWNCLYASGVLLPDPGAQDLQVLWDAHLSRLTPKPGKQKRA